MTTDERDEVTEDAIQLAGVAIRFSSLHYRLSNQQADAKAVTYGWLVVKLLEELIAEDEGVAEREDEARIYVLR